MEIEVSAKRPHKVAEFIAHLRRGLSDEEWACEGCPFTTLLGGQCQFEENRPYPCAEAEGILLKAQIALDSI